MIREPTANLTRAGAPVRQTATEPLEIEVLDFLSFDHVHVPFNEGYLRILRAAYPDDRISFRAAKGTLNDWRRGWPILPTSHLGLARLSRRHLAGPTIIPLPASRGASASVRSPSTPPDVVFA